MVTELIDFLGSCEVRGIRYISYLQPVILKDYYPLKLREGREFPTIEHICRYGFYLNFQENPFGMGEDFILPSKHIFDEANRMYADLNKKYPGHFESLTKIFLNVENDVYIDDGIHYNKEGNKMIAGTVMQDLIDKGIFKSRYLSK